jgi:hypothetical protein
MQWTLTGNVRLGIPGVYDMRAFLKKAYSDLMEKLLNICTAERREYISGNHGRESAIDEINQNHPARDSEGTVIKAAISGNFRIRFID